MLIYTDEAGRPITDQLHDSIVELLIKSVLCYTAPLYTRYFELRRPTSVRDSTPPGKAPMKR